MIKSSKNNQLSYLAWLVDMIKEKTCQLKDNYFLFHNAQCCKGVWFPVGRVTGSFLCAEKPKIPKNRLVGIYHSMTLPKYRSRVSYSLKDTGGASPHCDCNLCSRYGSKFSRCRICHSYWSSKKCY